MGHTIVGTHVTGMRVMIAPDCDLEDEVGSVDDGDPQPRVALIHDTNDLAVILEGTREELTTFFRQALAKCLHDGNWDPAPSPAHVEQPITMMERVSFPPPVEEWDQELDADTVAWLGLDPTGRDLDERFPYTWNGLTDDERARLMAATVKRLILVAIEEGWLPDTVSSFTDLHDYCDANMQFLSQVPVGDEHLPSNFPEQEWLDAHDAALVQLNKVTDLVHAWLKRGLHRNRKAISK